MINSRLWGVWDGAYFSMVFSSNQTSGSQNIGQRKNSIKKLEYKSGFQIIIDIIGNSSLLTFIVAIVLGISLSFCWNNINYCEAQTINLCADILTAYSCILGLVITGFSILLMLNSDTVEDLSGKYIKPKCKWSFLLNTKSSPYDILCSSFSLCFILLFITITVIVLYKNQPNIASAPSWQFFVIKVLSIMSAVYVIDLLFHLYEVSTFVNKNHREILKYRKK